MDLGLTCFLCGWFTKENTSALRFMWHGFRADVFSFVNHHHPLQLRCLSLSFLFGVHHLELRNWVVCMWQLPDIMALVPFISFCFLCVWLVCCRLCMTIGFYVYFGYNWCWSLDVCSSLWYKHGCCLIGFLGVTLKGSNIMWKNN